MRQLRKGKVVVLVFFALNWGRKLGQEKTGLVTLEWYPHYDTEYVKENI